jgi:hypothetical protein
MFRPAIVTTRHAAMTIKPVYKIGNRIRFSGENQDSGPAT